jgi:hypothetical protein
MIPTVIIRETGPVSADLTARDVRDLAHVRRLLLQAAISVESEGIVEHVVPMAKLHLLRGFLANAGAESTGEARRLLLMALLQLEDEDEDKRMVEASEILPVVVRER